MISKQKIEKQIKKIFNNYKKNWSNEICFFNIISEEFFISDDYNELAKDYIFVIHLELIFINKNNISLIADYVLDLHHYYYCSCN